MGAHHWLVAGVNTTMINYYTQMFSAMSDKSDCTELLVRSGAAVSSNIIADYY